MRSGLKTITGFSIIGTMSLIGMVGCGGEQPPAPAESETTARPAASSTGVTIPSDVATATGLVAKHEGVESRLVLAPTHLETDQ